MKKLIGLLLALLILPLSCDIVRGDTVSVTLTWTAPGDDGMIGACAYYDLRWSTDSTALVSDFATQSGGMLSMTPQPANSTEEHTVAGLESETVYFFAIKAVDEADNWSPLSNILRLMTPDSEAPAKITDLRVQ